MNKKLIIKVMGVLLLSLTLLISSFTNQTNAENQGGVICGEILDKDSGLGIADTLIRVEKNNEKFLTIWSNDEGDYKIANLEEGDYTLSIHPPRGYEPVDDKIVYIKQAEEKEVNFILIPHYDYVISGKVCKSDGKAPVEGAELTACNTEDNIPDGFADSKKDGTYVMDGLKPATYNLSCSSDETAFPIKKDIILTEEKTSGIDFIAYNNSISGVIKDEKGNSVKDAKVSLRYIPTIDDIQDSNILVMKMMGKISQDVKIDKNGGYKISSLTPGNYSIEIYSAKLERKMKEDIIVEQDTKRTNLDFTLGATKKVSSIYGKVTEEDGITPLSGVFIALVDSNNQPASERLDTNNEGIFKIEGLIEGIYYLGAQKNGLATVTKKIQVEGGKKRINVTLVMNIPGSISGVIYCKDKITLAENVKVLAIGNDSGGAANTDNRGFYKINNLKEGIYEVKAISLDGKKVSVENVEVKTNKETSNISIFLTK